MNAYIAANSSTIDVVENVCRIRDDADEAAIAVDTKFGPHPRLISCELDG